MGQHTISIFPSSASTYSGDWSNFSDSYSDSTSTYAHSEDRKIQNGFVRAILRFKGNSIPSYATINSITFRFVARVEKKGNGGVSNTEPCRYGYTTAVNMGSQSSLQYEISSSKKTFGTSWTTNDYTISSVSNSLISNGFSFYICLWNDNIWVQYIQVATFKLIVTYTVPDITYTYKNWDGATLSTQTVEQGTSPTAPSNPTRDADAEYTYTFSGWSLSGYVYTAQYTATKRSYTVTVNTDGNGTATGGGSYEHGESATLTATPNSGYKFKQWSDGSTENPRTVTVTGAAAYTAEFEAVSGCGCAYIGSTPLTVKAYVGTTKVRMFVGTTEII